MLDQTSLILGNNGFFSNRSTLVIPSPVHRSIYGFAILQGSSQLIILLGKAIIEGGHAHQPFEM